MIYREFSTLLGFTLISVRNTGDEILFATEEGGKFKLYHEQDCCESVYVEDVAGELEELLGVELLMAEEVSNGEGPGPLSEYEDSYTWTFYKLATIRGYVTIRFYGSSNGYYSESVSFVELEDSEWTG